MNIPQKLADLANQVVELAIATPGDFLADFAGGAPPSDFFVSRSPRDLRSTVTLDGDRGAGKTTLLLVAMLELSKRSNLVVLPVIKPEHFSRSDSLFGRTIEILADYVYTCRRDVYDKPGGEGTLLSTRFEHIANLEALTRRDKQTRYSFEQDATDIASDALMTTRRSNEFEAAWRPFLDEVLSSLQVERLIIPIDDADLSPQHLPWLLSDLRRLDDHSAVTCVVAINSDDLRDFLRGATLRASGLDALSFPRIGAVVSRQIEKSLPYQNWIRLQNWRPDRRLAFSDLANPDLNLELALARIRFGSLSVADRLRTASGMPSHFAGALPARPRPLEALLTELSNRSGPGLQDAFMHSLSEHLNDELHELIHPLPETFRWRRSVDGLEIELNLSHWHFFTDTEFGGPRGLSGTVQSVQGELQAEYTFQVSRGSFAKTGRSNADPRISQDATNSILLLLDIEARGGFCRTSLSGGRPVQGGTNWRRPMITCDGVDTDNNFIIPPRWEGYLEYFNLSEVTNKILYSLDESLINSTNDFIEWYACTQLWLIHELHRDPTGQTVQWPRALKALSPERAEAFQHEDNGWQKVRRRAARQLINSLSEAYIVAARRKNRTQVEYSFINWYETYFLWSLHPLIFKYDLVSIFAAAWRDATADSGRSRVAAAAARRSLSERLLRAGSTSWADDIARLGERLELGDEFDPQRRSQKATLATRRRAVASGVGRQAAVKADESELSPSPSSLKRSERDAVLSTVRRLADAWSDSQSGGDRPIDAERRLVTVCIGVLNQIRDGTLLDVSDRR